MPSLGYTKLGPNAAQAIQRYCAGERADLLCVEYGVSRDTLRRHLVANGVVLRDERAGCVRPTRGLEFDIEECAKLYSDKLLPSDILAKRYGCNSSTILRYLRKAGVAIRHHNDTKRRRRPNNYIQLDPANVALLYKEAGATLDSVAKQLGVCKPVVQRIVDEIGINKPNKCCGERHPRWRAHLTDEERAKRRDFNKQKLWRDKVFARDNYTCQSCKDNQGGNLNAHHIVAHADNRDLRWVTSNGITLCKTCHKRFHTRYGKQGFGRAELTAFLQEL